MKIQVKSHCSANAPLIIEQYEEPDQPELIWVQTGAGIALVNAVDLIKSINDVCEIASDPEHLIDRSKDKIETWKCFVCNSSNLMSREWCSVCRLGRKNDSINLKPKGT